MEEFKKQLSVVLDAALVMVFIHLWELDKSNGKEAGVSIEHYFGEIVDTGTKARTRSIEYSQKTREAKKLVETQTRDANAFKMSILQNPQCLSSADALLKHASNYNVPMSVVTEFLSKVGTIKAAEEQKPEQKPVAQPAAQPQPEKHDAKKTA